MLLKDKEGNEIPKSKNAISKKFRLKVESEGLEAVLGQLDADQQNCCLDSLEIKEVSGTSKVVAAKIASGMFYSSEVLLHSNVNF
jgi:hypothetical protein